MMKIKTEILKGTFILTFSGTNLDLIFAHGFFNAMRGSIQKGYKNIILDLSDISSVNSSELGVMIRSLRKINDSNQLILCGVDRQVLDLLGMSNVNDLFIYAADRNEALHNLPIEKNNVSIGTVASAKPVTVIEEDWLEVAEVVSDEEEEGEEEEETVKESPKPEKRKCRRIESFQILDEDIKVNCSNIQTGKAFKGSVLNISPGGMLILSVASIHKGDELIIQGNIGKNFNLKVSAVVLSAIDGRFGVEFSTPSEETVNFLNQLVGSVGLQRGMNTSSKSQF